jgi:DNA-binding CsgD family transcriptional regulator
MLRPAEKIAQSLIALRAINVTSRDLYTSVLREVLANHADYFSVWSVWEPNAFDGQDERFVNAPGHDETGRFVPSWHRNEAHLELHPVSGYSTPGPGDWYWIPKKTGLTCAMEPYMLSIGGHPYWITSEIAPILENGRCLGVVGIDYLSPNADATPTLRSKVPEVRVLGQTRGAEKLRLLTAREREVHFWLCQGKSNEEIGILLGISPHTVKNHLDHMFQKLGVENRTAAALIAQIA